MRSEDVAIEVTANIVPRLNPREPAPWFETMPSNQLVLESGAAGQSSYYGSEFAAVDRLG
jgi:hypothetical protein